MGLPFIAGLVGLGTSVGSAIVGGINNAKARRAQQRIIDEQLREHDAAAKKAYVDTAEARAVLDTARETTQEQAKRDEALTAMTGGTHEAKLAARDRANKSYANIIRNVASGANQYRNMLRNWKSNILGQQMNLEQQRAQSGNNLTQTGLNVGLAAAGSLSNGISQSPTFESPPASYSTGAQMAKRIKAPKPEINIKPKPLKLS